MKKNALPALLLLIACSLALSSCSIFGAKEERPAVCVKTLPPPEPPKSDLPYCKVDYDYPLTSLCNPKIYVYKGQRRLLLVQNDTLIRDYPVGLGPNPCGDKYLRGDGRTPEGDFLICVKNPKSNYYKSFGLNYPDLKRAKEAVMSGTISWGDYQTLLQASGNTNSLPPFNTPLGGAIMIHGGGSYRDWTLGCVAISNSSMDELFDVIPVGTPVKILP